jgi:uncharacterized PurR-regulated membrane protein YhhQ (DUF165 family)
VVRAFESTKISARGNAPIRMAVGVNDGPYRLRGASDAAWPSYGYGQRTTLGQRAGEALRAALRIVLPVVVLGAALGAMFLYLDRPLPYFADGQGPWLTVGHLLLPLAFLAVHLTNRRYGPAYAFAQVVLTLGALAGIVLFGGGITHSLQPATVLPSLREAAAFAGAFLVAGFVSIVAFDGARGPRWWMAPLIGSIVAAIVFAPAFYLSAYLGTPGLWLNHMAVHAGLLLAGAVFGLAPFWLLRGVVQPLSGFGGY